MSNELITAYNQGIHVMIPLKSKTYKEGEKEAEQMMEDIRSAIDIAQKAYKKEDGGKMFLKDLKRIDQQIKLVLKKLRE